ncbi:MAG: cupin domain-containing protein [Bacteroidota bacterium]
MTNDPMTTSAIFHPFANITPKEIVPGFTARFIHTQNNTISFWEVKAGSTLPMHSHMHEQSSFVLEGEFEMTIGGETKRLTTGLYAVIPPHTPHCGTAITDCKLLDVFSPVREDYK